LSWKHALDPITRLHIPRASYKNWCGVGAALGPRPDAALGAAARSDPIGCTAAPAALTARGGAVGFHAAHDGSGF
jgi:hypothetical protein